MHSTSERYSDNHLRTQRYSCGYVHRSTVKMLQRANIVYPECTLVHRTWQKIYVNGRHAGVAKHRFSLIGDAWVCTYCTLALKKLCSGKSHIEVCFWHAVELLSHTHESHFRYAYIGAWCREFSFCELVWLPSVHLERQHSVCNENTVFATFVQYELT